MESIVKIAINVKHANDKKNGRYQTCLETAVYF